MAKRSLVAAIGIALALSACAGSRDHKGFVLDPTLVDAIQPGVDNKESVTRTIGRPTYTSQWDPNDWYYVSRNTAQLAFRDPKVTEQTVLRVKFDPAGNVQKYPFSKDKKLAGYALYFTTLDKIDKDFYYSGCFNIKGLLSFESRGITFNVKQ